MAGVKRAPAAEPEQEEAKKPRAASLCASSPESSASEEDAPGEVWPRRSWPLNRGRPPPPPRTAVGPARYERHPPPRSLPPRAARGKDFVGWVDTEIVGHRHECANRGKYRLRETAAGRRLCCCEEAAEAAELCRDGGTLELRRNPQNRYDSNAVQVGEPVGCLGELHWHRRWGSRSHGMQAKQVHICHPDSLCVPAQVLGAVGCMLGHLPRDVAAELAPLLDSAKVWVQAEGFEVRFRGVREGWGALLSPGAAHTLSTANCMWPQQPRLLGRCCAQRVIAGGAAPYRCLPPRPPPR